MRIPAIRFARLPLALCALLWLNSACAAAEPGVESVRQWKVSGNLEVHELLPGVWLHTSWRTLKSGGRFPANGLLVKNNDELILIDTAWGAALTETLVDWVESELGMKIGLAIIGHFHADSMGGTAVLAAHGIPFVGSPLTRLLGKDEGVPLPSAIPGLKTGSVAPVGNVEVFYPGPAHSGDNLFVWVPEAGVLFGGCAVRSPSFPGLGNTKDADLDNWPTAIRRVQEQFPDIRWVVPGHGPVGGASLLSRTIALFDE